MAQMCGELCAGSCVGGTVCGSCIGGAVFEKLGGGAVWGSCVSFISCISDLVHSRTHGSVQYVILCHFSSNVLLRLFLWFSQIKHLECHYIRPPEEVQCVHTYSVAGTWSFVPMTI